MTRQLEHRRRPSAVSLAGWGVLAAGAVVLLVAVARHTHPGDRGQSETGQQAASAVASGPPIATVVASVALGVVVAAAVGAITGLRAALRRRREPAGTALSPDDPGGPTTAEDGAVPLRLIAVHELETSVQQPPAARASVVRATRPPDQSTW